jgi:hypothetical protein
MQESKYDLATDAVPFSPAGFRSLKIRPVPSAATLFRWKLHGISGVRIETFLRGGRRFVTPEAIAAFFQNTTAARDGHPAEPRTTSQRRRAMERAERDLRQLGM